MDDTTLLFHVAAAGGKYRAADVGSTSCQQLRNPAAANFWQQLADVADIVIPLLNHIHIIHSRLQW